MVGLERNFTVSDISHSLVLCLYSPELFITPPKRCVEKGKNSFPRARVPLYIYYPRKWSKRRNKAIYCLLCYILMIQTSPSRHKHKNQNQTFFRGVITQNVWIILVEMLFTTKFCPQNDILLNICYKIERLMLFYLRWNDCTIY